jgi:hypothetical protein
MATYLPFNRKERFFTGTVLPGLVTHDSFAHLDRLLDLCGLEGVLPPSAEERLHSVQFLTEYGFAESAWKDTSGRWTEYPPDRVRLVALLPAEYLAELGNLRFGAITWERVLDTYRDVAPTYWITVLSDAIDGYGALKSTFETKAEDTLLGDEIVARFERNDLSYQWMGRGGGLTGRLLASDIDSGSWRRQLYQLRTDLADPNRNWFPVEVFVAAVTGGARGAL